MAELDDAAIKGIEDHAMRVAEAKLKVRTLSALIDRSNFARSLGVTHAGQRDVHRVLGYDEFITTAQLRDRYERGGIAKSAVEAIPKAVWRGDGRLFEDDNNVEGGRPKTRPNGKRTVFEQQWHDFNDKLQVWSVLQRAHILASIHRFAGVLIGTKRGSLNSPLPVGKPGEVIFLKPIGGVVDDQNTSRLVATANPLEAAIRVKDYDTDTSSERFGLPLTYQLVGASFNEQVRNTDIHHTRIVHIPAYGFLDNEIVGPPTLEAVWNYLTDLDKVTGGGSEAFWLRANAGIQFDIDKKMALNPDPAQAQAELDALTEQAERYEHQLSRMVRTRGVNINQLGSDVADFSGPQAAIMDLIAGTLRIPKRVLLGSEAGQLASDQDRDNWDDQVGDCRSSYAHPIILRPFMRRLIDNGYFVSVPWDVEWPDEGAISDAEMFDAAMKLAALNDHGSLVVTQNEIRAFMRYRPFTEQEIQQHRDDEAEQALFGKPDPVDQPVPAPAGENH